MPSNGESSSRVAEQLKLRGPRRHKDPILETDLNPPQIPSIIQSARCKSSVSTLLLSTCSGDNSQIQNSSSSSAKKKNFATGSLRGLGCAASGQVSVPEAIRSSADWHAKRVRKKKGLQQGTGMGGNPSSSVAPDIWCGPGIGFTDGAASAAPVDCVVSRRPVAPPLPVSGRGKVDGDRMNHRERERSSCNGRRNGNSDYMSLLDLDSTFGRIHPESDVFGARYYRHVRHVRHRSPDGLAEIMLFRSSLLMRGREGGNDPHDRYRDWRLDVDHMSYEELLELGDRIGYVSTGLKEEEIKRCLRQTKHSILTELSLRLPSELESKCTICQEEYEEDDEMGKLKCGHYFHIDCVKQWLGQKNACPVCKADAVATQKEG